MVDRDSARMQAWRRDVRTNRAAFTQRQLLGGKQPSRGRWSYPNTGLLPTWLAPERLPKKTVVLTQVPRKAVTTPQRSEAKNNNRSHRITPKSWHTTCHWLARAVLSLS